MNKKILLLLHLPPPDYGVTLLNRNILNGHLMRNFELDYISINTSRRLEDIEKFSPEKIIIFLKRFLTLLKKLLINRYDLCYFTVTPTGIGFYKDFFLVALLKIFRMKIIYHLHGKGIAKRNSLLDRILYRMCFSNCKVIIMSGSLFYDIEKYADKRNVYVLPNGINEYSQNNTSASIVADRLNKKTVNLLFLSNMVKSKGVYIALEAAKILNTKNYDFKFYFVGGWYDITEEEFMDKINELNLDSRVEYLGFKDGKEKYRVLENVDIFVYPTFNDTLPLVLLEAVQFGLPVVSTFEGAIPDIIDDGINGFLVPKKNPIALAEKIEILINNPELRISMGIAGREKFLREYTFDKFENRLNDIFQKVINI